MSSVPFTSLWQHDAQKDSWAGYAFEKASILEALYTVKNVIVLSGDRHEFAAIRFNAQQDQHDIVEVSTSPMSMFYVPLVRTLRTSSEATVRRTVTTTSGIDNGTATPTVEIEIPAEEVLRYIAEGNYKWFVRLPLKCHVINVNFRQVIVRSGYTRPTISCRTSRDGN